MVVAPVVGMLIVCVGLVVDVGHAMLVQRQLQAGVDAAALAGAQHLPDPVMAESVAVQYSASPGAKNAVHTVNNAATIAKAQCIAGVPGCNRRDNGYNGIIVESRSNVPTWFGRIIGIDRLSVSAKATACSPCSVKPLDIMLVVDRTGSMCTPSGPGGSCPDFDNAKSGIETFLTLMDPTLDKVGLAVTPPSLNASQVQSCPNTPTSGAKYYGYDQWWQVDGQRQPPGGPTDPESSYYVLASLEGADGTLADDYIVQDPVDGSWDLNPASTLVQRLGCVRTNGSTSYSLSVEEANRELSVNGRGGVQNVIIFLSDGAANTSPLNVVPHWTVPSWKLKPCGAGVESARRVKAAGTIVYTIGYDLNAGAAVPEKCRQPNSSNGHQNGGNPLETGCGVAPSGWGGATTGCSAWDAIRAMASKDAAGTPLFYEQPVPADLSAIFRAIALDLSGSRGRLIDNTTPNLLIP